MVATKGWWLALRTILAGRLFTGHWLFGLGCRTATNEVTELVQEEAKGCTASTLGGLILPLSEFPSGEGSTQPPDCVPDMMKGSMQFCCAVAKDGVTETLFASVLDFARACFWGRKASRTEHWGLSWPQVKTANESPILAVLKWLQLDVFGWRQRNKTVMAGMGLETRRHTHSPGLGAEHDAV